MEHTNVAVYVSLLLACACKTSHHSAPSETSSAISLQGTADHTFYQCQNSMTYGNETLTYQIAHQFNNNFPVIDLKVKEPRHIREARQLQGSIETQNAPFRLIKGNTNKWIDDQFNFYTVRLTTKQNGEKSIEVHDHRLDRVIPAADGRCTVACTEGVMVYDEGRCVWSGISYRDVDSEVTAQILGELILTAGTSSALRSAFQRFIPAKASKAIAQAPLTTIPHRYVASFRASSYSTVQTVRPTYLIRVWGGRATETKGLYFTTFIPNNPEEAQRLLALLPEWGNACNRVSIVKVAPGVQFNVGLAGPQNSLPGGGIQWLLTIPEDIVQAGRGSTAHYVEQLYQNGTLKIVKRLSLE